MLAGLCKQHTSTQLAAIPAIEKVHLLEQVSTEKHIGTLAENVLEAMMENPDCQAEVCLLVNTVRFDQYSILCRESIYYLKSITHVYT